MSLARLAAAPVALLAVMIASATPAPRLISNHPAHPPGNSPLMVFGGRSAAQLRSGIGGKLDAALADLARHAGGARPDHTLEDLHAMNPAAKFMQHGAGAPALVAIDAVTRGDPQRLKDALESLGLEHAAVFRNDVGGWLPVSAIETAAARAEVTSIRAAMSRTRAVVATQGDYVQGTAALRQTYSLLDGTGVTVGVLSDSYDCYSVYAADAGTTISGVPDPPAAGAIGYASNGFTADAAMDVSTGALPSGVNVLAEAGGGGSGCVTSFGYPLELPFADEGRAMLQIVHAVAPGASLAFYTADNSEADFASGIQALANAGAQVIADDVGYFDEPFFQVGLIGESIDTVYGQGVAYFSAAGNNSNLAYDNPAPGANTTPSFSIAGSGQQAGEMLLNFDATNATQAPALTVNTPSTGILNGEFIAVVVEWDQPYVTGSAGSPGASSQIDLCVTVPTGSGISVIDLNGNSVTCTGPNATGVDPVQILIIGVPANGTATTAAAAVNISIGLAGGPAPGRIKLAWEDDGAGSTFANFAPTTNATIQGHPNDPNAATVGAAFFVNTIPCGLVPAAVLDGYSSFGGAPILFDNSGNAIANPTVPAKPDFVGPDGTNTTFFGFTLTSADDPSKVAGCANDTSLPNYFGTSAATPHAAAIAALMLEVDTSLTPTQIYAALRNSAAAMDNPSPDLQSGHGFIQADPAMAALPAGTVINVTPGTITVGQSATVTWNGIAANSCTGSDALSTSATIGTQTVTPASAGNQTYSLTCTNGNGSTKASVTLTVNAAAGGGGGGGGHGGGGLDDLTLLVLAGLVLARLALRYLSTLEHIREHEAIALDDLPDPHLNRCAEHRGGRYHGVELTVLAARIDARR